MENFDYETIHNFRRPSQKLRLYRHAAIDHSRQDEIENMLSKTGITLRLDLRSPLEVFRNELGIPPPGRKTTLSKVMTMGTSQTLDDPQMSLARSIVTHFKPLDVFKIVRNSKKKTEPVVSMSITETKGDHRVKTVNINFLGLNYIDEVVWDRCTLKDKFFLVRKILTLQFEELITFVGQKLISRGGLLGSYIDFLEYSSDAIVTALKLATEELEKPEGVVAANCFLAKDRSGLFVFLLRYIVGDSKDDVIEDYHESEKGLQYMKEFMINSFVKQGLPEEFALAPKQVMIDTIEYLEKTYGSIEEYLIQKGFSRDWMERLQKTVE